MTQHDQLHTPQSSASPAATVLRAEVVVVGGGFAGLAAATAMARSRRDVVVIDAGQPRNAPAEAAHNVLGHEGIAPTALLAKARAEAESYGVRIVSGRAVGLSGAVDDFTVEVDGDAPVVRGRRVILATGLLDELPDVPGLEQGWGHSVLHCPFCHGWEVRDQRIAVLASGEGFLHQAMLFRQLSDRLTVLLHEMPEPTPEQMRQLEAMGAQIVRSRVERIHVQDRQVDFVDVEGGERFEVDAVVVAPRFNARTDLYESIGGTAEETLFGRQIPTNPQGMTPIPGIWSAGNASQPMTMVVSAAAAGVMAGAGVHGELAMADLARAVDGGSARQ